MGNDIVIALELTDWELGLSTCIVYCEILHK